jgi:hypothetical protein
MKSATTSVFRWLDAHPDTAMPQVKEPQFFSSEATWRKGEAWYRSLFPVGGGLTGEASPAYTDPAFNRVAADRIRQVLPRARLVCVLRDPAGRARSQYLHQVRRGRERRPFLAAITEPGSSYVAQSCYLTSLRPYLDAPDLADRLLVLRTEDLTGPDPAAWQALLDHLGLARMDRPESVENEGSRGAHYTPVMRVLYGLGVQRIERRIPPSIRKVARRFLIAEPTSNDALVASAKDPVPDAIVDLWRQEVHELSTTLGRDLAAGWSLARQDGT